MTINQHNNKKHKEYRKIKTKLCNLFFIIFDKKNNFIYTVNATDETQ